MRSSKTLPAALAKHLDAGVRKARRRYHKRLERCQKKFSEGAVHELRVENRRILALLDLIASLGLDGAVKKLARNFKKRLDVFDGLRDTQVQLRHLKPLWRGFPEAHRLKTILQRREARLVSRLASEIKATKDTRLNRRLKEVEKCLRSCADGKSRKLAAQLAAAALRETFQRVLALRRQVRASEPATIHRLRVSFKRFRYVSELLRPLLPGLTAAQIDRMKEYQAAAGEIQDLEVLLARLAQVVADRKLSPAAVRNLRSELLRQKREAIDSFMARIDDLLEFQIPSVRRPRAKT
jgi:CHAD domain-containing protein